MPISLSQIGVRAQDLWRALVASVQRERESARETERQAPSDLLLSLVSQIFLSLVSSTLQWLWQIARCVGHVRCRRWSFGNDIPISLSDRRSLSRSLSVYLYVSLSERETERATARRAPSNLLFSVVSLTHQSLSLRSAFVPGRAFAPPPTVEETTTELR